MEYERKFVTNEKRKSKLFGQRSIVENTFGEATGERAPRLARLVKLRREAKGDLGIWDFGSVSIWSVRDDVWCHVVMVSCKQGIPDDKLRWLQTLHSRWLCYWADNLPLFSHTKSPTQDCFFIVLFALYFLSTSDKLKAFKQNHVINNGQNWYLP